MHEFFLFFARMCVHTVLSRFGSQVFRWEYAVDIGRNQKDDQLKVYEWQK